jgi:ribonuclease P protein component
VVFAAGRRSADQLFTVLYRQTDLGRPRLGMTASAKRLRTAVARNRVRRLIRESFRRATPTLPGLDIVVIVREPASRSPNAAIFASLDAHWAQLRRNGEDARAGMQEKR